PNLGLDEQHLAICHCVPPGETARSAPIVRGVQGIDAIPPPIQAKTGIGASYTPDSPQPCRSALAPQGPDDPILGLGGLGPGRIEVGAVAAEELDFHVAEGLEGRTAGLRL